MRNCDGHTTIIHLDANRFNTNLKFDVAAVCLIYVFVHCGLLLSRFFYY